jgi:hypothetical protein
MVTTGRNEVNEDNLPSFSDSEDYVDDITNEGKKLIRFQAPILKNKCKNIQKMNRAFARTDGQRASS